MTDRRVAYVWKMPRLDAEFPPRHHTGVATSSVARREFFFSSPKVVRTLNAFLWSGSRPYLQRFS